MNKRTRQNHRFKAVGLISGGLDSILAAKIIMDLGFEVHGVHFKMPWENSEKTVAEEAAKQIGIKYVNMELDNRYIEMVRNPKHGYGSAMNPCIDCHAYMLQTAAEYMRTIGAKFIFTGEVLGQRPMSQKAHSLKKVERESGLEGKLLRPLSAKRLNPTIPEQEGIIDRNKMLDITGRSRREQIQLADDLGITKYKQPAGGCLLTDHHFGHRLKDLFDHGYQDHQDTAILKWGRHFRIDDGHKAVIGRDERENGVIERHAAKNDWIMFFADEQKTGPTVLLKGNNPCEDVLATAAGLLQWFSKYRNGDALEVRYWMVKDPDHAKTITARGIDPKDLQQMQI